MEQTVFFLEQTFSSLRYTLHIRIVRELCYMGGAQHHLRKISSWIAGKKKNRIINIFLVNFTPLITISRVLRIIPLKKFQFLFYSLYIHNIRLLQKAWLLNVTSFKSLVAIPSKMNLESVFDLLFNWLAALWLLMISSISRYLKYKFNQNYKKYYDGWKWISSPLP